jgi:hypothetical protein
MKPFTNLHAFIDGINVDADITPCIQLTITGEVGKFEGFSDVSPSNNYTLLRSWNVGISQNNTYSMYPNGYWQLNNLITKGEVIRYYTTSTTFYAGIVIARQVQQDPVTRITSTVLHVALAQFYTTTSAYTDNFSNVTPTPFPVGATIKGDISGATATVSAVTIPAPGAINSNSIGNFFGILTIPTGTITTGSHNIVFTDSSSGDIASASTSSSNTFTSYGEVDVYTQTIVNRIDTFVTTTNTYRTTYYDPLAETFMIPATKTDGCFVTSVDLYFAKKAANETQPVTVQIVQTLNGYPTQNVLFNAVAQVAAGDIQVSADASIPTRFRFVGPVFLEPNKEYALKVISNSVSYFVWISQMGEASVKDPTKLISTQPYLGTLFKSQNNSTWTPDQLQDLMFTLYYAQFTQTSGLVTLQNQSNASSFASLPTNPFMVANGSTVCKVHYPDHGLFSGAFVTLSGATSSVFNGTFTVQSVINTDYFTITLSAAQSFNGLTGGSAVLATKSIKYDSLIVNVGDYSSRTGTSITTTIRGATANTKETTTTSVNYTTPTTMNGVHYIHSDLNEGLMIGGSKSLDVNFNLISNSTDLSPALNRNTLSALVASNKINVPAPTDSTVVDNHTIANALAGITFTATTNVIGIPTTQDINQYKIGAYITISGTTNNNITTQIVSIDNTVNPYQVTVSNNLTTESPAATTIVQAEGYIDEIAPIGGTAESKYQTVPITLDQPATGLQIMFSANIPVAADIRLYYRTAMNNSSLKLENTKWTAVSMSYRKSQGTEYLDQTYTLNALANFNAAQFKLVFVSTDSTQVPTVKDFRAICLA